MSEGGGGGGGGGVTYRGMRGWFMMDRSKFSSGISGWLEDRCYFQTWSSPPKSFVQNPGACFNKHKERPFCYGQIALEDMVRCQVGQSIVLIGLYWNIPPQRKASGPSPPMY